MHDETWLIAAYFVCSFVMAVVCRVMDKEDVSLTAYLSATIVGMAWPLVVFFVATERSARLVLKVKGSSDDNQP